MDRDLSQHTCPHCNRSVVYNADGTCPSCGRSPSSTEPAPPSPTKRSDGVDRDDVDARLENLQSRALKKSWKVCFVPANGPGFGHFFWSFIILLPIILFGCDTGFKHSSTSERSLEVAIAGFMALSVFAARITDHVITAIKSINTLNNNLMQEIDALKREIREKK